MFKQKREASENVKRDFYKTHSGMREEVIAIEAELAGLREEFRKAATAKDDKVCSTIEDKMDKAQARLNRAKARADAFMEGLPEVEKQARALAREAVEHGVEDMRAYNERVYEFVQKDIAKAKEDYLDVVRQLRNLLTEANAHWHEVRAHQRAEIPGSKAENIPPVNSSHHKPFRLVIDEEAIKRAMGRDHIWV